MVTLPVSAARMTGAARAAHKLDLSFQPASPPSTGPVHRERTVKGLSPGQLREGM
jgi:hypothetical protein